MNVYDDLEKLKVLNYAHDLALDVYNYSKEYPQEEIYGLTSQIRRSAVSVGSNIAEGKSRGSDRDYVRFLKISRGSLSELKFQLSLSKNLGYMYEKNYNLLMNKCMTLGGMLGNLINAIERS